MLSLELLKKFAQTNAKVDAKSAFEYFKLHDDCYCSFCKENIARAIETNESLFVNIDQEYDFVVHFELEEANRNIVC